MYGCLGYVEEYGVRFGLNGWVFGIRGGIRSEVWFEWLGLGMDIAVMVVDDGV